MTSDADQYPEEVKRLTADARGRISLGSEYADTTVRVAVIEVVEE
jgi:hypothetical protein